MRIGIIAPYESMLDSVEEMPLPDGVELVTAVATYDSALEEVIKMEKKESRYLFLAVLLSLL